MNKSPENTRVLLVGSNSFNLFNYYQLIQGKVSHIQVVCARKTGYCTQIDGVKYVNASYRKAWLLFKDIKILKQVIQETKPDVIHIHQIVLLAALMIFANRETKIPVIVTAWGSDMLINPRRSWILKKVVQYVLHRANIFTANSAFLEKNMRFYAKKEITIERCHYGIDMKDDKTEKENMIFSNRQLYPLYRIDSIIRNFYQFHQKHPEWTLVIAAEGSEKQNLQILVHHLNLQLNVKFVGWLSNEENIRYYCKSKIWVSVPKSDSTAVSLLEAMYYGAIPVVYDLPASQEWITDGVNGIVVSNLEEDFLERALRVDAARCATINREKVMTEASKELNREKFLQLYQQLIQENAVTSQ
jgi:glycosyltransferase involved in cell wall biosynthesis